MDAMTPNEEVAHFSECLREDPERANLYHTLAETHWLYAEILRAHAGERASMLELADMAEHSAQRAEGRANFFAERHKRLSKQVAEVVQEAYDAPPETHVAFNQAHISWTAYFATGRFLHRPQPLTPEEIECSVFSDEPPY